MNCNVCGAPLKEDAAFCMNCGSPVQINPTQPFAEPGVNTPAETQQQSQQPPQQASFNYVPNQPQFPPQQPPQFPPQQPPQFPPQQPPQFPSQQPPQFQYNPQAQQQYNQPYEQNQYTPVPPTYMLVSETVPGKGLGIASMVTGILSLVFTCFPIISVPLSLAGIIMGIISLMKAKKAHKTCAPAITGVICSGVGVLFMLAVYGDSLLSFLGSNIGLGAAEDF